MGFPIRHIFLYIFLFAYLATSSLAQLVSSLLPPTPTSSAAVQTHTISVGNGDHKFRPDVTQAEIGDIIEFQFFPPNHSVVRAEYQYPCIPYEMTGRGKVGFFSGFHPVDAILDNPPTWSITINDTDPIFFYCSATGSCIEHQMVGVINPNATVSLADQKTIAGNSSYMLQPGESFPGEGTPSALASSTAIPSSTSSSTPSATAIPTSGSSPSATAEPTSKHGLSTGVIVGIAIAGVAILALAAALFFFIGRSKTLKEERDRRDTQHTQSLGDMFHAFPPPKADGMSNASTRNSTAAIPGGVQHGVYGNQTPEMKSPEYSYHGAGSEDAHLRSVTASPGSDLGHGRNVSNPINHGAPLRHPTVLLNPNAPRELYAPDGRYTG